MDQRTAAPGASPNRKWMWLAMVALVAVGIVTAVFTQRPATKSVLGHEISVAEAVTRQEKGSFLLDVREPDEWAAAHVSGSTLIPLGELEGRVAEVPRDREIVVVCRSGNRSKAGRDILLAAGYTQVTSMSGGLLAWKAEGHPTVVGP